MTSIIIEPQTKTVWEGPFPLEVRPSVHIRGLGLIHTDPMSVFEPGIFPWFFEPLGIQLGRMLIAEPELPLPAVERLVTWIRATMVINQATLIIPYRTNP
jgi:hypothetical protein